LQLFSPEATLIGDQVLINVDAHGPKLLEFLYIVAKQHNDNMILAQTPPKNFSSIKAFLVSVLAKTDSRNLNKIKK